jgi:hypothetical protein
MKWTFRFAVVGIVYAVSAGVVGALTGRLEVMMVLLFAGALTARIAGTARSADPTNSVKSPAPSVQVAVLPDSCGSCHKGG